MLLQVTLIKLTVYSHTPLMHTCMHTHMHKLKKIPLKVDEEVVWKGKRRGISKSEEGKKR